MRPLDPAELPEYTDRACEALRIDPKARFEDFLVALGLENVWVSEGPGGRLAAGAAFIPTAQRVGGAWVPSALVTAVWAAPAARGRGVATALIGELAEEMRRAGFAMSMLVPANLALYRRAGYEVAAAKYAVTVPTGKLPVKAPEGWTLEPLDDVTPTAPGVLADVYDAALPHLGATAPRREHALWHGLLRWNEGGRTVVVAARDPAGAIRGTAVVATRHTHEVVKAYELQALDADAARTLLAFVAGYRGFFPTANWWGGPADPFVALLREEPEDVRALPLMVRVLDVAAALAARGYPRGVEAAVELDVADESLPANAGPLVLSLDGSGAGRVEPGAGAGRVRVGVRALAALFTGHATPRELALRGGLTGPAEDLDVLAAAFAGPVPWLTDRF